MSSDFPRFQSLSGFLIDCDGPVARILKAFSQKEFQSLSGFLIDCDGAEIEESDMVILVSIPIGFSD